MLLAACPAPRLLQQLAMMDLDLPRERLYRRGVTRAADEELLAIVLNHADTAIAKELVTATGNLGTLSRASPHEMRQTRGIGEAHAARLTAAFELGRRAVERQQTRRSIADPDDVHALLAPRVANLDQEVFIVMGIDVRNALLEIVEVARGSVHGVEVHPREVFRPLIRMAAAGAVIVHNHPSGDPTPSAEDIALTQRMKDVGELMGIPIVDHIVIGGDRWRSLRTWLQ